MPVSMLLHSLVRLDVLTNTPAAILGRAPSTHGHLQPLATIPHEETAQTSDGALLLLVRGV